jgi:hypothetical protein
MERHLTERELIEYRFRLASDEQAGSGGEHLARCAECRERLERLNRKFASLDLLREDVHASEELISQVLSQTKNDGRRTMDDGRFVSHPPASAGASLSPRKRGFLVPRLSSRWVGAVAAVLVVGLAVLIGSLTQERADKQEFARESPPRLPVGRQERGQPVASDQVSSARPEVEESSKTLVASQPSNTPSEGPMPLSQTQPEAKVMMVAKEPSPPAAQPAPAGDLAPAQDRKDMYAMAPQKPAMPTKEESGRAVAAGAGGAAGVEAVAEQPPFAPASAIELVTLPRRDNVQLTIYNSADLTLVQERRNLTLKKGWNWLQFMWANTLIDPTSLSLEPLERRGEIDVQQLVFPARLRELGRWLIRSQISGQVPFEITYFTSGLSWRAFYMGTLSRDEKTMKLQGYVRVGNNSGEDYENAQTRLIVGQVHLLDQIRELAQRQYPYGSPVPADRLGGAAGFGGGLYRHDKDISSLIVNGQAAVLDLEESLERKEIRKEGLSEYFLYTIEGTETIPNEWGKRLLSFEAEDIKVESLYKYDQERWGGQTISFVKFANDKKHNLGQTPIPDGDVKIYGLADEQGYLSYVGGTSVKYIPVNEEVELNLGPARLVQAEPKLMDFKTENYAFDNNGNVAGWEEVRTWKIETTNTRTLPIEIEITRGFGTPYWTLQADVPYEKYDATHVRFKLQLEPASKRAFDYTVRTYHGTREETLAQRQ